MPIAPLPSSGPAPAFPVKPRKPVPPARETSSHPARHGFKLLLALLFVAVGLFAVLAYNYWFAAPAAPVAVARPPEPAPAPAEKPAAPAQTDPATEIPAAPVSEAGKLVAQVKETVAAHDAAHAAPVEAVLTPPASEPPAVSEKQLPEAAPESAVEEPAPVVTPPPASAPVAAVAENSRPEPGAAFRSFVASMKIAGVFQGENARAMINGKMYRLGETVDPKLGIVFRRLEPDNKRIVFEDPRGAVISRRY